MHRIDSDTSKFPKRHLITLEFPSAKLSQGESSVYFEKRQLTVHINKRSVHTPGLNSNYESHVSHFCLVQCLWESVAGGPELLARIGAQFSSTSQVLSETGTSAYQPDKLSDRKLLTEELTEFILNLLFWFYIICLRLSIRSCS